MAKDLEKIDYGYCIPDCGVCCEGVRTPVEEGERIAEMLSVDISEIYNHERQGIKKVNGNCMFLSDYSLCKVHTSKPQECNDFPENPISCNVYWNVLALEIIGIPIKDQLKKMFLEAISNNYNKQGWLSEARKYVLQKFEEHSKNLEAHLMEKIKMNLVK